MHFSPMILNAKVKGQKKIELKKSFSLADKNYTKSKANSKIVLY